MSYSDWIEFGVGAITLIGIIISAIISVKAISKSTKENREAINAQWDLYNKNKTDEEQKTLQDKIKAAYIITNIIPSIILEGFITCKKCDGSKNQYSQMRDASIAFIEYDFINGIQMIRDFLSKDELLYLYKLSALINKLKVLLKGQVQVTLADKDRYVYKSEYQAYHQLVTAFVDGFPDCNEKYHCFNLDNKNRNGVPMPFEKIFVQSPENITKDDILQKCNSYFKNSSNEDIYTKLINLGSVNNG